MTTPITYTHEGATLHLAGDTFTHRHKLASLGGKWNATDKRWELPDNQESRDFAHYLSTLEVPAKRGRGRPPGSPNKPKPQAPLGCAPVREEQGEEEQYAPETPQGAPDLMAALHAFVAANAGTKAAPIDADAVAAIVAERIDPVFDLLGALEAKLSGVKANHLVITQGETVRQIEGLQHAKLPDLIKCLSAGLHVWLAGPSGSGKTHAAEQAAKALGLSFGLHGAMTMAHELTGFVDAGGRYHDTPFVRAFRNGGVILLDELDAGSNEALLALNAALANGIMCLPNGDNIPAHPDFKCIGAANTYGQGATHEYVGRTRIDAAFLQRFGAAIAWDYDESLEDAMSGNPAWVKRVQDARKKAATVGLKVLITPRSSQAGARLIAAGYSPDQAAELTYMRGLSADQKRQLGA
jgi:hypothetical protein